MVCLCDGMDNSFLFFGRYSSLFAQLLNSSSIRPDCGRKICFHDLFGGGAAGPARPRPQTETALTGADVLINQDCRMH